MGRTPKFPEPRIWTDVNGKIWTLDHGRVASYRLAERPRMRIQWATEAEIQKGNWKMSTENGGKSIQLKLGPGHEIKVK